MNCIIDSREQSRIPIAKEYYESQGLKVSVKELNTGDYLFDNEVVMEFKTFSDFISSITDGRLFNETISQIENYDMHFLVLHGTNRDYQQALLHTGLDEKHVTGALARLLTFTKITCSYHIYSSTRSTTLIYRQRCLVEDASTTIAE